MLTLVLYRNPHAKLSDTFRLLFKKRIGHILLIHHTDTKDKRVASPTSEMQQCFGGMKDMKDCAFPQDLAGKW